MAEHTAGPWQAVKYRGEPGSERHWSGYHIKQHDSGLTDVAYVDDVDYGPEVGEANARLIAAAPELLATLEAILARLIERCPKTTEGHLMTNAHENAAITAARAAIRKARGE